MGSFVPNNLKKYNCDYCAAKELLLQPDVKSDKANETWRLVYRQ